MNDKELDEMLNAWKMPAVPPSLRAGLRLQFPAKQVRKIAGIPMRWILALAIGAGAVVGASLVTDGVVGSDAARWDDQTFVRRTLIVQPAIAKLNWWRLMSGRSTGYQWQAGRITGSMYVFNRITRSHSGYTWQALPAGEGEYLFTVLPLDPAVVKEGGAIVPLPELPAPVRIRSGSSFEVPVYVAGGVRVYHRYEIAAEALPMEMRVDAAEQAAMITLTNPQLYRGGTFAAGPGGVVEAKGASVTVNVAGLGRFVLVVDRQTNTKFVEAGRVSGNSIEFEHAGERFRIDCSAPVTSRGERPLYVYFAAGPGDGSTFGSGGWPSQSK